jgi:hypothetical protein
MASSIVGTIELLAKMNTSDYEKGASKVKSSNSEMEKSAKSTGEKVSGVGKSLTKTLTPAAAALGVVFMKAGQDWKAGTNAIIVGTGASGKALESMQGIMKNLAGEVPQGVGEIGDAVAELNTRLGLTGKPLEQMSKKFLNFARLTGQDVATSVGQVTRVFGDWDIAAKDQTKTMDMLFKAGQLTGIGVDRLSEKIVQFGAPLRSMGFSIEESTAMLGKWEKEGVNTEKILGSLSLAANNFAKKGIDMKKGLQDTIKEIKGAENSSKALAIAQGVVGSRAANDFQAAVREGRFELGDMIDALDDSGGAIDDAAKRTLTLTDRISMMKDGVMAAIGPWGEMGGIVFGALAAIGPTLMGIGAIMQTTAAKAVASAIATSTAYVASAVATAAAWAIANAAMLLGIGLVVAAVVGAAILIVKNWDWIKEKALAVWEAITGAVKKAFNWVKKNWPLILGIIAGPMGLAVGMVVKHFDRIRKAVQSVFNWIRGAFSTIAGIGTSVIKGAVNGVLGFAERTINGFINLINKALGAINKLPGVNIGKISTINVPKLAQGGIITSPTLAMVGEGREPEAVIPISKLDKMLSGDGGGKGVTINQTNNVYSDTDMDKTLSTLAWRMANV